jgi:Mor family transcriptional regulator
MPKLVPEKTQRLIIEEWKCGGISQGELAKKYNVTRWFVNLIVNGRRRKRKPVEKFSKSICPITGW